MKIKRNLGTIGEYKIKMTAHACQRANQRNVDPLKIVASIFSFGSDKLNEYSTKQVDIMIKDPQNNISIVFAANKKTVTIITVIDDIDVYTRNYPDTIINEL